MKTVEKVNGGGGRLAQYKKLWLRWYCFSHFGPGRNVLMIDWLWGGRGKFRRAQVLSLRGGGSFYITLFSILVEILLYIVNPSLSLSQKKIREELAVHPPPRLRCTSLRSTYTLSSYYIYILLYCIYISFRINLATALLNLVSIYVDLVRERVCRKELTL